MVYKSRRGFWSTMDEMDASPTYRRGSQQPRASVSLTDLRTPIVDNFLSMLPMGHEKALKYAFYNVIAMIVAAGIVLAFWGVYCILEPFIKALLWATLCGSVLHPFKEHLCSLARMWLKNVKKSPVPFSVRVVGVPVIVADSVSDKIGTYIWKYWKSILIAFATFFVTYIIYYNPPVTVVAFLQYFLLSLWNLLWWILSWINGVIVITLNVIYLSAVAHVIVSRKTAATARSATTGDKAAGKDMPEAVDSGVSKQVVDSKHVVHLAYVAWFATICYVCFKLPYTLLVGLIIVVGTGAIVYAKQQRQKSFHYTLPRISRMAAMMVLNIGNDGNGRKKRRQTYVAPSFAEGFSLSPPELSGTLLAPASAGKTPLQRSLSEGPRTLHSSGIEDEVSPLQMPSPIMSANTSAAEDEVDGHSVDSNKFLYGVFCACMIVFVWNRLWLMHLIPIPIVYYGLKKLSLRFGLPAIIKDKVIQPCVQCFRELEDEGSLLIPEPVKVFFRILHAGDRKLISLCEPYIDPVASLLVVVLVVMATILGLIFASTQVYAEGDHLVRVTRNLINTTVSQHPELNQLLPEGWQSMMNSMVANAFHYGRDYISNMIRDSVAETNPEKAEQIEKQVIELWDRIYLAWNQTWENAFTNVTHKKQHDGIEWNELLETGKEVPNLLELSVLTDYARANVGTLWSIMDALWKILVGNISLAVSALYSIISLLFGGGHAILNLIINLVVFFTALFYLLSASTSVYKPVELFNQLSPGTGVHTNRFALAFEEAVNGVFVASFKMAAFYGMWTWLIHTLFQVNIVFVPSIFGGLFAAVPFLMPYWAALPAVLELWLIQGHWPKALCMLLAQMAPMSAVDTQIYSEIKGGGHPYLTGLAVAGGIFYFGVQGAIMGPVILCLVFVAVKVGNSFLWEGNETELLAESKRLNRRQRSFGDQLDGSGEGATQQDSSISSC